MIKGTVVGQKLTLQKPLIVSDTINYLTALFEFETEGWEGLEKWAHFRKGKLLYDIKLKEDRIPAEAGLNLAEGQWELYLHGSRYEDGEVTCRITTDWEKLMVQQAGDLEGAPLPVTPPSVGEQLEARIRAVEESLEGFDTAEEIMTQVDEKLEDAISALPTKEELMEDVDPKLAKKANLYDASVRFSVTDDLLEYNGDYANYTFVAPTDAKGFYFGSYGTLDIMFGVSVNGKGVTNGGPGADGESFIEVALSKGDQVKLELGWAATQITGIDAYVLFPGVTVDLKDAYLLAEENAKKLQNTEDWVFTLEDGTEVTKKVVLG